MKTSPTLRTATAVGTIAIVLLSLGSPTVNAAPPATIPFDLLFPSGYSLSRVTVGASEDIVLGSGALIQTVDGSPGIVTNSGNGTLIVRPGASAGSLVSTSSIQLDPNVVVASVKSAGIVALSPGDTIGDIEQGAALTPLVHRTVIVPSLDGTPSDVSVKPGSSATLPPGRYGSVTIGSRAVVTVSAGTYLLDRFVLMPQAQLHLDTSGGTVYLYASTSASWKGDVFGDATRFVFGFLGHGSLVFENVFLGTALAPFGTLELRPSSTVYQGTFYGRHVVVWPQVTVRKLPTPMLVDGITVSNTAPCIGEPVEVSVALDPSLDNNGAGPGATTWVQGVVGPHQFVQFRDAPGPRTVYATVYAPDGRADFTSVPVTLQRCAPQPGSAPPIALHFWPALSNRNVVELMVHGYDGNGHEVPSSGPATYAWSFGDGQTMTTSSPFVSHDYTPAIDPLVQYNYFDVSVTVTNGSGAATATKVVPIWSLYAKNRVKGIIQPPNTLSLSSSSLALTVTNHEPTPIAITQGQVELIPCDPALESRPQPPQTLSVAIPGGSTATVDVGQPPSAPSDVCGLGVHLTGSGAAGRVYTDAYTSLKENPHLVQAVTDAGTIALLNQAAALTKDPNQFDEFELRQLYADGLIPQLPPSAPTAAASKLANTLPSRLAADLAIADPNIGDPCTAGDISPLGWVCGPTQNWVVVGPEILNAFKGNFIMDHGCGSIGKLLSAVHQLFSHTSTIVTNRVAVRHSTASSDRMNSNVDYVNEQLDPDTLQFGYPGTAGPTQTYTIEQMVTEYFVTDPDDPSKTWRMGGELDRDPSKCTNDTTAIQPLVIRPAPDAPASVLQGVASAAAHTDINSHYRFFHYSRADESLSGSGWAAGTEATVCSSFDRLAAVRAGLPLHPTLKVPGVPDGMRQYLVDERVAAGNALYAQVSNDVGEACNPTVSGAVVGGAGYLLGGPIGGVIGGVLGTAYCERMIGHIANQVNNCFANDGCDDTGSAWRNPGTGVAVSPDDILDWDTWQKGGTYGYNEPLVYKPKGYRHAYAWAASPGSGAMTVKIVHPDHTPYPNATVLINTNAIGTTDNNGIFQIPVLAAGDYEVGAQFDPCAQPGHPNTCTLPLEQAAKVVTLPQGGSITVELILCAGPIVNGVVTSCPQAGAGPVIKVAAQVFQTTGSDPEQLGFNLCIIGSGFTPGAGSSGVPPVDLLFSDVPTQSGPITFPPSIVVDASGNFTWTHKFFPRDRYACSQQEGEVTISASDNATDTAAVSHLPAQLWCRFDGLESFYGDPSISCFLP
jgi:PKD domain-containing protein